MRTPPARCQTSSVRGRSSTSTTARTHRTRPAASRVVPPAWPRARSHPQRLAQGRRRGRCGRAAHPSRDRPPADPAPHGPATARRRGASEDPRGQPQRKHDDHRAAHYVAVGQRLVAHGVTNDRTQLVHAVRKFGVRDARDRAAHPTSSAVGSVRHGPPRSRSSIRAPARPECTSDATRETRRGSAGAGRSNPGRARRDVVEAQVHRLGGVSGVDVARLVLQPQRQRRVAGAGDPHALEARDPGALPRSLLAGARAAQPPVRAHDGRRLPGRVRPRHVERPGGAPALAARNGHASGGRRSVVVDADRAIDRGGVAGRIHRDETQRVRAVGHAAGIETDAGVRDVHAGPGTREVARHACRPARAREVDEREGVAPVDLSVDVANAHVVERARPRRFRPRCQPSPNSSPPFGDSEGAESSRTVTVTSLRLIHVSSEEVGQPPAASQRTPARTFWCPRRSTVYGPAKYVNPPGWLTQSPGKPHRWSPGWKASPSHANTPNDQQPEARPPDARKVDRLEGGAGRRSRRSATPTPRRRAARRPRCGRRGRRVRS